MKQLTIVVLGLLIFFFALEFYIFFTIYSIFYKDIFDIIFCASMAAIMIGTVYQMIKGFQYEKEKNN